MPAKIEQLRAAEGTNWGERDSPPESWNVFTDDVVTQTKLRPLPKQNYRLPTIGEFHSVREQVLEPLKSPKRTIVPTGHAKQKRSPRNSIQDKAIEKRQQPAERVTNVVEGSDRGNSSSTNSDRPLIPSSRKRLRAHITHPAAMNLHLSSSSRPSRSRLTPTMTSHPHISGRLTPLKSQLTPSETILRSHSAQTLPQAPVISLDSSPEREMPQRSRKLTRRDPNAIESPHIKPNHDLTVKEEPLGWNARARTELLVSTSNEKEKAPIIVNLNGCHTSVELFDMLTRECELRMDVARRVKRISATYKWNSQRLGLRRDNEGDWTRLIKTVRKAWNAEDFDDVCEIEMLIHVDE